jgi:hypothetical protein
VKPTTSVPVYVRVGDLSEHQVGTIEWGRAELSQRALAQLLRATAREIEKQADSEYGQVVAKDETDETFNLTVYPDDPPKSGEWVDADEAIANLTPEEAEQGRKLGEEEVEDDG